MVLCTISTLIPPFSCVGRYYQAWLEGGGGAYPEAVEEEHSDELPEEEDNHGKQVKPCGGK